MIREEAQKILATWLVSSKGVDGQRGYIEGWFDEDDAEAFRMAIEALQDTPTKYTNTPTDTPTNTPTDLISRQDAIKALYKYSFVSKSVIESEINAIPSATPLTGKWIRCKEQDKADLDNGNALYECSNCGHTDLHAETQEVPYCWFCGSRMLGEDGE